jgi:hypothetical protein
MGIVAAVEAISTVEANAAGTGRTAATGADPAAQPARLTGNHLDPVRTGHLGDGNAGNGSRPDHPAPASSRAEENDDDERPGRLDR